MPRDPNRYATSDGKPPHPEYNGDNSPAPQPVDPATGQHRAYWVLSESERRRGFVRPLRTSYLHTKCNRRTSMGVLIAESFAADPNYYGSTFCTSCGKHFPLAEFRWVDQSGKLTEEILGS